MTLPITKTTQSNLIIVISIFYFILLLLINQNNMGISNSIKAIVIYMALIIVFFTFAVLKANAQNVISYIALKEDHAWGCSPKYPRFCVKEKANP